MPLPKNKKTKRFLVPCLLCVTHKFGVMGSCLLSIDVTEIGWKYIVQKSIEDEVKELTNGWKQKTEIKYAIFKFY